jgi:hypothetical protein
MVSTRTLLTLSIAALVLTGCSVASRLESSFGMKYRYSYALVSPKSAWKRAYLDKRIKMLFLIDDGAVRFKLSNLSDETMTIDWPNASVGVSGRYYTVRNARTYYGQSPVSTGPPIPPKGYVIDLAIPAQNVSYDGKAWQERDLLPTTDRHSETVRKRILGSTGRTVDLILPIQFEQSGTITYNFRFSVAAVNELPWNRYKRPHRPPAPRPVNPVKVTSNDQVITAAIIAGVLGISAVLLTQKKAPPSE